MLEWMQDYLNPFTKINLCIKSCTGLNMPIIRLTDSFDKSAGWCTCCLGGITLFDSILIPISTTFPGKHTDAPLY